GLHRRAGVFAVLEGEGGLGEFRHHVGPGEGAQVAALGGGGSLGIFARQFGEVGVLAQLGNDVLGLGFAVNQDVAGADLLLALQVLRNLVVAFLHRVVGELVVDRLRQIGPLQNFALGLAHLLLNLGQLIHLGLARSRGRQLGVDQIVEDRR